MPKEIEENEVDPSKVEHVEEKIEDIKEEIEETPEEDRDKEWRDNLTASLASLTEEIKGLREAKGESAALAVMQQQIKKLTTALEAFTAPKITPEALPKPEPAKEGDPPSLETPKETSLETEVKEPKEEPKPARKNQRAWL